MCQRLYNYSLVIYVVISSLLIISSAEESESWSDSLNRLLKNCANNYNNNNNHINNEKNEFLDNLKYCLQKRAVIAMDAFFSEETIPVLNGVDFVKFDEKNSTDYKSESFNAARAAGKTWPQIVFSRFARLFKTHVIKIDIDRIINPEAFVDSSSNDVIEGRRRHHRRRNHLMPMLMMGVLVMGSVLIPMGFQFLAVLGGKALLLAKLALMLSSIQGLKKIATNGVNYGLYHAPVSDGWHERSSRPEPLGPFELPYAAYARH
ncbi:uncharacterized protein LOC130677382 [Microplitis mediator]|uniref:uncharacterized protein LOC130677382 n=1 Tax=Microplitis mediator TaxID=375433 RepID=UPI002552827D|nr:uncharacterized protein LOC130677382 [Microplitis mediator]